MVENKPEIVTDTEQVTEESTEQVVQARMSEARQNLEENSKLVPEDSTVRPADVSTQEDSSKNDATNIVMLKALEASTGRKFESIEDFNKHYRGLSSLVGDQEIIRLRKAAETLEKLEKDRALAESLPQVKPTETRPEPRVNIQPQTVKLDDELDKRLEALEHQSQLNALEKKYPKATIVAMEVALVAKSKGISYTEAFENSPSLKEYVELKDKEESQRSPVVTPSNRISADFKKLEQLGLKVMSGKARESDQIAFAKEFFKTRGREL